MKDELITFETAKLAKEKGFDIGIMDGEYVLEGDRICRVHKEYTGFKGRERDWYFIDYPDTLLRPTQSLLQRWLREMYNLEINIQTTPTFDSIHTSKYKAFIGRSFQPFKWTTGKFYIGDTYEQALEQALVEALNLIKL